MLVRVPSNTENFEVRDLKSASSSDFVESWRALSKNTLVPNPFWEPGFCLPAIEHLASEDVKLAVQNCGNSVVAIAPFTIERIGEVGPKVCRLWAHDYLPIGSPLVAQDCPGALIALLSDLNHKTNLPVLAPLLEAPITNHLKNNWDGYIKLISTDKRAAIVSNETAENYRKLYFSKQRRAGLDRRFRRLQEATSQIGDLSIEMAREPYSVAFELERFLNLEHVGWKGKAKTSLLSNKHDAEFIRTAVGEMSRRESTAIATLKAGDKLIASLILLVNGNSFYSWKTAFDESFSQYSPGVQLLARFADPIRSEGKPFRLDSCSSPDNTLANVLMNERLRATTLVLHNKPNSLQAQAAAHTLKTLMVARQTVKSILNGS